MQSEEFSRTNFLETTREFIKSVRNQEEIYPQKWISKRFGYCDCGREIKQYPEGDDTMEICEDCR